MNDFIENDVIMYGSFPLSFPLGTGLKKGGTINKYQSVHLLKQWHQELSGPRIVFHMFETWRRHVTAQTVTRRVKNTPDSLKQFGELIHSEEFQESLLRAQKYPTGDEAKEVLLKVQSILSSDATKVSYSPSERAHAAVEIINIIRE